MLLLGACSQDSSGVLSDMYNPYWGFGMCGACDKFGELFCMFNAHDLYKSNHR